MQRPVISGTIVVSEERKQKKLNRQLLQFANWMAQTRDAQEIRKDKRKSVPVAMLPMVF